MSEPLTRKKLFSVPPRAEPLPSPETIAAVATTNGFRQTTAETPIAVPPADQADKRRRRQPTGRVNQFTTRLRQDTLDAIYSEANDRNIPIAQVIEEAMAALKKQQYPA